MESLMGPSGHFKNSSLLISPFYYFSMAVKELGEVGERDWGIYSSRSSVFWRAVRGAGHRVGWGVAVELPSFKKYRYNKNNNK